MPRGVVDVEAAADQLATVAIVNFAAKQIGQANLPAAQLKKRQRQAALALIAGVIDDDEISRAVVPGPGVCNKIVRGPVAGPSQLRLDLRPGAVAEGRNLL